MQLMTVSVEKIAIGTDKQDNKHVLTELCEVFEGEVGTLEGELHFVTDPAVPPGELDKLLNLDVITPVDTPTDWICSPVVTMKPNGKVRLCIDLKPLKKGISMNDYPTKTSDDVIEELQESQNFTHLVAKNGSWHVVLFYDYV